MKSHILEKIKYIKSLVKSVVKDIVKESKLFYVKNIKCLIFKSSF